MTVKNSFDKRAAQPKTYSFGMTKNLPVPMHLSLKDTPAWEERQGQKLAQDIQKFVTDQNRSGELVLLQVIPTTQQLHLECTRALACDLADAFRAKLMPGAAAPPCTHSPHPRPLMRQPKK